MAYWKPGHGARVRELAATGLGHAAVARQMTLEGRKSTGDAIRSYLKLYAIRGEPTPHNEASMWRGEVGATAKAMWLAGASGDDVAKWASKATGKTVTRNAAVGYMLRAGLKRSDEAATASMRSGGKSIRRAGDAKKAAKPAPKTPPPKSINDAPHPPTAKLAHDRLWLPLDGVEPVAFMERQRLQCAWPIDGEEYRCCGAGVREGSSYCFTHWRWSSVPVAVRKRRAA